MESIRQLQVAEIIRREISGILQQEGTYIYGSALVTVTGAKITPDLSIARIYVSVFQEANKQGVVDAIEHSMPRLRFELSKRVAKQLRRMPSLQFYLDESVGEAQRLDKILDELKEKENWD